jgi:hypothetical protein
MDGSRWSAEQSETACRRQPEGDGRRPGATDPALRESDTTERTINWACALKGRESGHSCLICSGEIRLNQTQSNQFRPKFFLPCRNDPVTERLPTSPFA